MRKPRKFIQKELEEVEAVRWTGNNKEAVYELFGEEQSSFMFDGKDFFLSTDEGELETLDVGNWLVKYDENKFTQSDDDTFREFWQRTDRDVVRSITPLGEGLLSPSQACSEALAQSHEFNKVVIVYADFDDAPGVITSNINLNELFGVSEFLSTIAKMMQESDD